MTRITASTMLPPSYHPSFQPCCLIPKKRERKQSANQENDDSGVVKRFKDKRKKAFGRRLREHVDTEDTFSVINVILVVVADAMLQIGFKKLGEFFDASNNLGERLIDHHFAKNNVELK